MKGFTKRDYAVAAAIIIGVLGTWFVFMFALLHIFLAGFVVPAWLILVAVTFWAIKRKR